MIEKYSLKETKEMLSLIFGLSNAISSSMADGKIDVFDVSNFFGVFGKIGPAFSGSNKILVELEDLDETEKKELIEFVEREYSFPIEYVEKAVKMAITALISFIPVIKLVQQKQ